jgi:hypothetical protein
MAAPTVHLLSSASFAAVAIPDVQSATIDDGGNVVDFVSADDADVKLTAVDRIGANVVVNCLGYNAAPAVGDAGALSLVLKPRVEGKGVTGSGVTVSYANAVCTGKSSGPVIEGSPTYSISFRAHAAP